MPLTFAKPGSWVSIRRISGSDKTKHFLENLGFIPESSIQLISSNESGVIASAKGVRVALSREMAARIFV